MDPLNPQGFLAILLGGMALLIPLAGLTARFALKPLVEAWAHARNPSIDANFALAAKVELLEHRLAELEAQTPLTSGSSLLSDRAGSS